MRIAILSDIHANQEALTACLAAIEAAHADRLVILGDIVGYGADPVWCLDKTRELLATGAIVLRGNHDDAVAKSTQSMNLYARLAIEWTRNQLSAEDRTFLGSLPMQVAEDDRLYVHASANAPEAWHYMLDADDARGHFLHCDAAVSFCGHTHQPALFSASPAGKITTFTPGAAEPIPLGPQRQWLAVMGSVGQPRDGNPAAAFALYDTETRTLRFQRTAYDIEAAARKILAAGLPEALAERLFAGH
ncbi:metallophosphoesterase family protein [Rhizobium sp. TH2]|uniref:metallophosphoesterase family protein n=1 Tax=Rhizobium sp. TH2 TaxID=2775403 RepID=UPI0021578CD0|nr:metallophosphoesterase family protein [Rhizobium sp. TH2]UVC07815.1 metallophosphoesterase family protein [Rhizobium sp. TH2]